MMSMSDMRFIMIGLVAITIGFIVLGVFGAQFTEITVQTKEFSECYKYPEDQPPVKIECDQYLGEKTILFVIVIAQYENCIFQLYLKFLMPSNYCHYLRLFLKRLKSVEDLRINKHLLG